MTAQPTYRLRYEIRVDDPREHVLGVTLAIETDDALPDPLELFLPVWTPGSYLVREYARHVSHVELDGQPPGARIRKVRKNAWRVPTGGARAVRVRYRVYANDLTVRTNHVDEGHAYWNGAATYLVPSGAADVVARVVPRMHDGWSVGTGMREADDEPGAWEARGLDELFDAPFECGPMTRRGFRMHDRAHDVWVWDNAHARTVDWDRVVVDTSIIVKTEAHLLAGDGDPSRALPYDRYTILFHVSPRGRGGLEHATSCSLVVPPSTFTTRAGYLDVLSLTAHEILHLWNVKRIRPGGLAPYRYEEENYTRLLWWFEGGTSYFDWRILRLAGLCTPREWADHLGAELARVADTPGSRMHALSDASFDAWIKAYRPDENQVNTTISYYTKGEIVCMLLDLSIRARSEQRRSLDDVLRYLWTHHGDPSRAVPEDGMAEVIRAATGVDVADLLARWVDSAAPLDEAPVLATAGLVFQRGKPRGGATCSLGIRHRGRKGAVVVDAVLRGGAAMRGGIDAGDEIVAIDDRRVEEGGLDAVLAKLPAGKEVSVIVSRDGLLVTKDVTLDPPAPGEGRLAVREGATASELALLDAWMGKGASTQLRSAT